LNRLAQRNISMASFGTVESHIHQKSLDYYLGLKYPITLYPGDQGGYVATIKDLPGCMSQGTDLQETIDNINYAKDLWLFTTYKSSADIPLPTV